ncbi:MAG: hypothetical protein ACD_10C00455G0002 [uncultured bacterium]|nr:MAG: hypothetical protein ACD_10C00455G0002 [uncultured bacterium]
MIIWPFGRMTVNGVMAEICLAANKPFGKWRTGIITYLGERLLPINKLGLLGPKLIRLFDRVLVKFFVSRH